MKQETAGIPFLFLILGILFTIASADEDRYTLAFEGNKAFSVSTLEAQTGIPEEFGLIDAPRREFLARIGRNNLEEFYYTEGYFSIHIGLELKEGADSSITYLYTISEGVQYKFRKVELEYPMDAMQLLESSMLNTTGEAYFDFDDIAEDLQMIRTLYRRNGYLHLRVDHREIVDSIAKAVDVTYSINPGNQVKMGGLRARATRGGRKDLAQRGLTDTIWFAKQWEIDSGQTIDGTYLSDFRTKLLGTQIFSQLTVDDTLRTDGSGLSDITIRATERIPGDSKIGTFFEQTYGFGFSGETRHRNLFGSFHEGSLQASIAQNRQEAIIGYANPLLFGTAIRMIPTAIRLDSRQIFSHEKLPLPQYPDSIEERYDAATQLDLTFGISAHVRSRSGAEVRYINKVVSKLIRFKTETGLIFDFTDDPFDPLQGIRVSPTIGIGRMLRPDSLAFGAPYPFIEIQNAFYLKIYGPLSVAVAYDYGKFLSESSEEDARAFYQGGSRSVRGYRFRSILPYRELPPVAPDTDLIVDPGLTPRYHRLSQELRLRIPWKPMQDFQIVEFVDWARVEDEQNIYKASEEMAVGGGIRYRWKVLTLRLDYTWKKTFHNAGPEPFDRSRITFDLSQAI